MTGLANVTSTTSKVDYYFLTASTWGDDYSVIVRIFGNSYDTNLDSNNWYTIKGYSLTNKGTVEINNTSHSETQEAPTDNYPFCMKIYQSTGSGTKIKWDWVFIVKYTSPAPSVTTFGAEETSEAPPPAPTRRPNYIIIPQGL